MLSLTLLAPRSNAQALELIAAGLEMPSAAINWPGNPDLFVIAQRGAKKVTLHAPSPQGWLEAATPIADLSGVAAFPGGGSCIDLYGITGIAFHPEFNDNRTKRFLYIRFNRPDPTSSGTATEIREYPIAPGMRTVGPSTRLIYSQIDQSSAHVIGQLLFQRSSSGTASSNLLAGIGDGTSAFVGGAPGDCYVAIDGQNPNGLNGRIVAFDVDQSSPSPVTLAYGLRNPWGLASDAGSSTGNGLGDLWIGDTGEDTTGNVYMVPSAGPVPNFGWPCRQWSDTSNHPNYLDLVGPCSTEAQCTPLAPLTSPAHVVLKADLGLSGPTARDALIGGFVYRGAMIPTMAGRYLFGTFGVASSPPYRPKLLSVDAVTPSEIPIGHLGSVVGGAGGISPLAGTLNLVGVSEGATGEPILTFVNCGQETGRVFRVIP